MIEAWSEIDELKGRQRPREARVFARSEQQGNDPLVVSSRIQSKQEFSLHPLRADGMRRQHNKKPIAFVQGAANFIVPLLRAGNVPFAVPVGNFVSLENPRKSDNK